jgi:hypothetical protein
MHPRGTAAARRAGMARPLRRDVFSWFCTLPSSVILIVCVFLPQQKTCQHRVETPLDNGSALLLVVMAGVALLPLLWRWRQARDPIAIFTVGTALIVAMISVIGIVVAGVLAIVRPWRSTEELVALCAFALTLAFALLYPIVFLFSTTLVGGALSWATCVPIAVGMIAWISAACTRTALREWASPDDARIC